MEMPKDCAFLVGVFRIPKVIFQGKRFNQVAILNRATTHFYDFNSINTNNIYSGYPLQ